MVINGTQARIYWNSENEREEIHHRDAKFCSVARWRAVWSRFLGIRWQRRGGRKGGALLQGWFAKLFAPEGSPVSAEAGSRDPLRGGWQRKFLLAGNERPCWPFFGPKNEPGGGIRGISAATATSTGRDFRPRKDRNPMFHGIMIVLSTGNEGISFIAAPPILRSAEKWDDREGGRGRRVAFVNWVAS